MLSPALWVTKINQDNKTTAKATHAFASSSEHDAVLPHADLPPSDEADVVHVY